MKIFYQIIDNKTGVRLSKKYEFMADAEKDLEYLRENVYHSDISILTDNEPNLRFTVWCKRVDLDVWNIMIDFNTIAEAAERILYYMDLEAPEWRYEYRVCHTGYPEFIVLEMKSGDYYPREEDKDLS